MSSTRDDEAVPPVSFTVEAGHLLLFARAIGDVNPIYSDPEYAAASTVGTVLAPPTFSIASAQFTPGYSMRPEPGTPWFGSGREATGADPNAPATPTRLHAEQHYEFFKPLRPGTRVTQRSFPGDTWSKEGRRGGTLVFRETITELTDDSGALVQRSRTVTVEPQHVVQKET